MGACLALGLPMALADDQQAPAADRAVTQQAQPTPHGTAGMRIYVDPDTGEVGVPPAGSQAAVPDAAFSTSSDGLREVPSPESGSMVDLQGRFRSPLMATIGPEGKLNIRHQHQPVQQPAIDPKED